MRRPRCVLLSNDQGWVHQFWRCHNKEFYLAASAMKALYLFCVKLAMKTHNKERLLRIHAYTVMDNHFHNLIHYSEGSATLSRFLKQAHTIFGIRFNRIHQRSGKVAEDRPKTSLIENVEHLMRVHFYIEANPIRAGKCNLDRLRFNKYCSYRFYAYGITDEYTSMLSVPDWYVRLGKNSQQRQSRYRDLFRKYLGEVTNSFDLLAPFIGSELWQLTSLSRVKKDLISRATARSLSFQELVPG